MSSKGWFGSSSHRMVLLIIGLGSVAAAVGAQFAPESLFDVRSASTPQLLGLLGLLVLPAVTAFALLADSHFLRRRRASLDSAAEPARLRATPPPSPVDALLTERACPVPAEVSQRPSAWPSGPQPPRVHSPSTSGLTPRRPVPRIEIIVERRPAPQVLVLSAPVGRDVAPTPPRVKSAA